MTGGGGLLQICPYDHAPFGELTEVYRLAARSIGLDSTTVFITPAHSSPHPEAHYLDIRPRELSRTRIITTALNRFADRSWSVALCHRYRSYTAAVASALQATCWIALAHEYGMLARLNRRLRRLAHRHVHFAGVAEGIAAELARHTGETLIMPNALDLDRCRAELLSTAEARAVLGIEPGSFAVGTVGRLHYKKRPQLGLEAFAQLRRDLPEATLTMVGHGPEGPPLQALNPPGVSFAGQVTAMRTKMSAFDALLHPASAEPFGVVVLEALEAGVPVVCKRGDGPEYVLGDLGVYVEEDTPEGFAEALLRCRDIDRNTLMARGRQRADELFSIEAVARLLTRLTTGQE